eukprot:COSAG01_NODE_124_length_25180_cov_12.776112_14_plen_234_part_00
MQCFHELRPGERQADAQERHLEYVEYTSTVGEHLDGKAIQAALDERHGVRSGGVRQQKLHKRLRQIAQLRAMEEAGRELRPEQLALVAREPALRSELQTLTAPRPATKDWDLREAVRPHGRGRPWRAETQPRCTGGGRVGRTILRATRAGCTSGAAAARAGIQRGAAQRVEVHGGGSRKTRGRHNGAQHKLQDAALHAGQESAELHRGQKTPWRDTTHQPATRHRALHPQRGC